MGSEVQQSTGAPKASHAPATGGLRNGGLRAILEILRNTIENQRNLKGNEKCSQIVRHVFQYVLMFFKDCLTNTTQVSRRSHKNTQGPMKSEARLIPTCSFV